MAKRNREKQRQVESKQPNVTGLTADQEKRAPGLPQAGGGVGLSQQAARLGDRRMHNAQRQAIALRIGRTQGNRHVQRVVASMRSTPRARGQTPGEAGGTETVDGVGSSGPPTMAAALPPEPPAGGRGSVERAVQRAQQGTTTIQTDVLDDARAAARGLLNRLLGQANTEQSDLQSQSSSSATEVDTTSTAQGAQLQSDATTGGAQVTAAGSAEQASLESQARAEGVTLQAQASVTEAQMHTHLAGAQVQADAMGTELEGSVQGQTAALNGEAGGLVGQLVGEWSGQEQSVSLPLEGLEREARSLYTATQGRARRLLARSQEGDVSDAARTVEAAWDRFLDRIVPFRRMFGEVWARFSRWASTLFAPLVRRIRQFARWIGERLQAIGQRMQRLWSRVSRAVDRARRRIGDLVRRARVRVLRFARTTLRRARAAARRTLQTVRRVATRARSFVQRTGRRLVSRLRQSANRAVARVRQGASRILRFFARAVNRAVSGLRRVAGPAVSALRRGAGVAWRGLSTVGRVALDGLREVGSRTVRGVQVAGERIRRGLERVGTTSLRLLSRAWRGIQGTWNGLRERLGAQFRRLRGQVESLGTTLRDRYFRPAWNWVRSRWDMLRERVGSTLGRLVRGFRRLKAWARSAWARVRSGGREAGEAVAGEARERVEAPFESVFYKGRRGAATRSTDPRAARARLRAGRPLDGRVRSRMESAFGRSFRGVRVHTGSEGAQVARETDARAVTVGSDVAFAPGEYQPGTPIGDALIAHELAHVIQQDRAQAAEGRRGGDMTLESDADRSAVGAVAALWTGARDTASHIPQAALPRLRSGLRLSSCGKSYPEGVPYPTVTIGEVKQPGENLPEGATDRIKPGARTPVQVRVEGWQDAMPSIEVTAEEGSRPSTYATVNGEQKAEIQSNGAHTVQVSGRQPATRRELQLVVRVADHVLGRSNTFVIAAYPSAVHFTFRDTMTGTAHGGRRYWGAIYDVSIASDSGNSEDLALVEVTEIIEKGGTSGFFGEIPLGRSGFKSALSPDPDHHGVSFASSEAFQAVIDTDAGAAGEQIQYFRFAGGAARIPQNYTEGPVIPASGFRISLKVSKTSDGRRFLHVAKQGSENHDAQPGTVSDPSEKKIEVT